MPRKPTGRPTGRPPGSGKLGETERLTVRLPVSMIQQLTLYAEARAFTRGDPDLSSGVRELLTHALACPYKRQTGSVPMPAYTNGQTGRVPAPSRDEIQQTGSVPPYHGDTSEQTVSVPALGEEREEVTALALVPTPTVTALVPDMACEPSPPAPVPGVLPPLPSGSLAAGAQNAAVLSAKEAAVSFLSETLCTQNPLHTYPGTTPPLTQRYRSGDQECVLCTRARKAKHKAKTKAKKQAVQALA